MRAVDIGFGKVAFEPDSDADRVGSIDVATLRTQGVTDQVIAMYEAYRSRYHREQFSVDPTYSVQVMDSGTPPSLPVGRFPDPDRAL